MMENHKTVVVFGATGRQGGSVAKVLNDSTEFKVRAVTRRPRSKSAKWLKEIGVEVVKGDLEDLASLKPILKGVYGCFLVTDFWEKCDKGTELKQGENVVNLSKIYGIQHLVFSGLESTWELSGLKCDHFEGKARIEDYIKQVHIPYTIVRLPQFMENFLDCYPPCRQPDGQFSLQVSVGNSKIYFIPATEIGHCVLKIFLVRDKYLNKTIGLASDYLTIKQCAEVMNSALKPAKFYDSELTGEKYVKKDFANVEDLANMFEFIKRGRMDRDITLTRTLDPSISDFKTWVEKHKDKLVRLLNSQKTISGIK